MTINEFDTKLFNTVLREHFDDAKTVFSPSEVLYIIDQFRQVDKYLGNNKVSAPAYKVIKYFDEFVFTRAISNLDSIILVSGNKGAGKSNLAVVLALLWCKRLGIKFNRKRHIVYTNEQLMEAIDTLPPFSPIVCDESINFALAENWAKLENKEVKKKLAQIRTKHFYFILCFPLKIHKVEKTYLDSYVNYWIDVYARGKGIIFIKDLNPGNDAWRINDFKDLGSYNEFTPPAQVKKLLSKHPNFWQTMNIPRLPASVYKNYLKTRESNIYNDPTVSQISRFDVVRALVIRTLKDMLMKESGPTIKRLSTHIRLQNDVDINEQELNNVFSDADSLLERAKELDLIGKATAVENAKIVRAFGKNLLSQNAKEASGVVGVDKQITDALDG